jgi:hypothetical protein
MEAARKQQLKFKLLPYTDYTFRTELSKHEVLRRIYLNTEIDQGFSVKKLLLPKHSKAFSGKVFEHSFDLNYALPMSGTKRNGIDLTGKVKEVEGQTEVQIEIANGDVGFPGLFVIGIGILLVATYVSIVQISEGEFPFIFFGLIGFMAMGYFLFLFQFKALRNGALSTLMEILKEEGMEGAK